MRRAEEWAKELRAKLDCIEGLIDDDLRGLVQLWAKEALRAYARECVEAWREKAVKRVEGVCRAQGLHGHNEICPICADQSAALRTLPGETL